MSNRNSRSKTMRIHNELNGILDGHIEDRGFNTDGFEQEDLNGRWVSRSILKRWENETPLNPTELESFHFLRRNMEFMETFMVMADQVRDQGRTKYSAATLVQVLRWNSDITQTLTLDEDEDEEYSLNDHVCSTLSSIHNELSLPQLPLFEIRSAGRAGEAW